MSPVEGSEPELDAIASHAAQACDVPAAVVAVLDGARLLFKARVGVQLAEVPAPQPAWPRSPPELIVSEDVRRDHDLSHHPLLETWPGARLFAAAPLLDRQGVLVGALAVLDRRSRPLLPAHADTLRFLAGHAVGLLDLRKRVRTLLRIVESVPERIYAFDRRGRCVFATFDAALAAKIHPAQLIGRGAAEVGLDAECAAMLGPLIDRVVQSAVEEQAQCGPARTVLHAAPVRGPRGDVEAVVVRVSS